MDWADEIANIVVTKLFPPVEPLYDPAWSEAPITVEEHRANIAAALRKAKADGMREFGVWIENKTMEEYATPDLPCSWHAKDLRQQARIMADKIEKGEA